MIDQSTLTPEAEKSNNSNAETPPDPLTVRETGTLHPLKTTFGKCPETLMHDLSITDGAVRLYSHMHWRYGLNKDNHEGMKSMAQKMGVTEKTISARIRELETTDWVVTVERDFNPTTGHYQTPHYHVFESTEDCIAFRESYQAQDGETIRPKPKTRKERKPRTGVGGNVTHRNSSSTGDHRNSSSDAHRNLSSDNTDSVNDTDSDSLSSFSNEDRVAPDQKDDAAPEQADADSVAKPRAKNPSEPHFRQLAEAFEFDADDLMKNKTAASSFWKVAYELRMMKFDPKHIPSLYEYVAEKADEEEWKTFTVLALSKYAPHFLRDNKPKINRNGVREVQPQKKLRTRELKPHWHAYEIAVDLGYDPLAVTDEQYQHISWEYEQRAARGDYKDDPV